MTLELTKCPRVACLSPSTPHPSGLAKEPRPIRGSRGFFRLGRDAQGSRGARGGLPRNALHLHMHAIAKMTAIAFTSR
jgi:hypothetical protein